mgnify:FL=1
MDIVIKENINLSELVDIYREDWHKEIWEDSDKIVYYGKTTVEINNSTREMNYVIFKDGDYYVPQCLDIDVASCGDTLEEAKEMMKEALIVHLK